MLSYEGIFFEGDAVDFIHSLEGERLPVVNDEIHCTFKYHPEDDEIFDELVGREFEILIVGYASNGENSGFEIELPEELKKYYINYESVDPLLIKTPHITASLAEGAKASNTVKLNFVRLEKPVKIKGKFGFWIKEEDKEYLSYDKYDRPKHM